MGDTALKSQSVIDYHIFGQLKEELDGHHFDDNETVAAIITQTFVLGLSNNIEDVCVELS